MTASRPVALIRIELDSALEYRNQYLSRPAADEWVSIMREQNEREIVSLERELAEALSGELEISLSGLPIEGSRVSVPYLSRVLESLQATFRSMMASSASGPLKRADATLSVTATAPGSFRVFIATPPVQLSLTEQPLSDQSFATILNILKEAESGAIVGTGQEWAARADEGAVRGMIRLAVALAGAHGTTRIMWRPVSGPEQAVQLSWEACRLLAESLAGEVGQEIVTITGHLSRAQDDPPRVKISTATDEYIAAVRTSDLLNEVSALLFKNVTATLVIAMRTSPTTGKPDTDTELIELVEAQPDSPDSAL